MSQPADKVATTATDPASAPVVGEIATATPADVVVNAPATDAPVPASTAVPVVSVDASAPAPDAASTSAATEDVTEATTTQPNERISASPSPSPAPSVTVVLSKPQTTAEMIVVRALKRAARRTAVREKAEEFKRAGDLLFESRKYKAAYPHYLEAIQLWSSNPEYFISLAGVYRKLQWYEEAAHAATRALTLQPSNTTARYIRGVSRMEQRLLHPAKLDFETVLRHEPGHLLARAALTEVVHFISVSTSLGTHTIEAPGDVVLDGTGVAVGAEAQGLSGVDFGYPKFEDEGLEVDEGSDSSDWNHVGNGVQCRFYNHEGCKRGTECGFMHAPDERSVRDELGRNVCTYHLLSLCKFGASKCIYSHSTDALPPKGWWSSPAQIEKAKEMLEASEKRNREERERQKEERETQRRERERQRKEREEKRREREREGLKAKGGEGKGSTAAVVGETAAAAAPRKKQAPVQGQGQKRKAQSRRKKPSTPSTATFAPTTTATTNASTTVDVKELKDRERAGEGFTEYRLNVQPQDEAVEPDTSVVLEY